MNSRSARGEVELRAPDPARARDAEISTGLADAFGRRVISGFDATRALAISLVLVEHLGGVRYPTGALGVMIFFVLSGCLITRILLGEYRKSSDISLRTFYLRRAFRIFPTFYVCWVVETILLLIHHTFQVAPALVSFFYMMDYGRALFWPNAGLNLHMWISWSLAIEEKFYLLWPALLLFLLTRRMNLMRSLVVIIVGQWAYRALLFLGFRVSSGYLYQAFDARFDALLIGCLLAVVLQHESTSRYLHWALRSRWMALASASLLVVSLFDRSGSKVLALAIMSLQPVVIAVFLTQVVYFTAKSWRPLRSAPVAFLAHISYALYLWHAVVEDEFIRLHPAHPRAKAAIVAIAVSVVSYLCVEKPFMRLRDRNRPGALHRALSAEGALHGAALQTKPVPDTTAL